MALFGFRSRLPALALVAFLTELTGCGREQGSTTTDEALGSGGTQNQGGATPLPSTGGSSSLGTGGTLSGGSGGIPSAGTGGLTIPSCLLSESAPLQVATAGAIVENLHIMADSATPAIEVTAANVTLRNLWIEHSVGPGIRFNNADNLKIENVHIVFLGAPATGQNPSANALNITGANSKKVQISNAKLEKGSSGIYLVSSDDSLLTNIEGHDFRGPFPRGQLVQWNKSNRGTLDGFSCENTAASWPEDNINAYQSLDMTIRNGLLDGNNSPTGIGVIFDGGTSTGLVESVDAIHMGNGCFSSYAGGEGSIFRATRCRDNICTDQGRGLPSSKALLWAGSPSLSQLRIENSAYFAACNPANLVWPAGSFELAEVAKVDFTPKKPLRLEFCWQ